MAASRFGKYATDLKYVAIGVAVGNYASFYIDICAVKGRSMLPTLDGERVVVAKRNVFDLEKGSIYTFRHPNEPEKVIVKRVVGEEGDQFWSQGRAISVPRGHIWIEGDNEHQSEDSRHYGPIPSGLVIGKAHGIIWPPTRCQWLEKRDVSHRLYTPPPPNYWDEEDDNQTYQSLESALQIQEEMESISNFIDEPNYDNDIAVDELPPSAMEIPQTELPTAPEIEMELPSVSQSETTCENTKGSAPS